MKTTSIALFTRPGLADLVGRVRESLPDHAQEILDEHVTQADRVAAEAFEGLTPWRLTGSDLLWFKASEYAEASGLTPRAASWHIDSMLKRHEVADDDIRKNVRDSALDANWKSDFQLENDGSPVRLTTSPTGVTMLSPRALLLLSQRSDSERGQRLRASLLRLMEQSATMERLLLAQLLAEHERVVVAALPPPTAPGIHVLRDFAERMMNAPDVRMRGALYLELARHPERVDAIAAAVVEGDQEVVREFTAALVSMPARFSRPFERMIGARVRDLTIETARDDEARLLAIVRELLDRDGSEVVRHAEGRWVGIQPHALEALLVAHGADMMTTLRRWKAAGILVTNHGYRLKTSIGGAGVTVIAFSTRGWTPSPVH